ncbi:MAG: hypothetical protein ACJ73E_13250 [Mycobacteriales bacterium]
MSLLNSRVSRRTALVAGGGGALVAAVAAAAGSSPAAANDDDEVPVVPVVLTDAGFSMRSTVRAGLVTFKVSTPEQTYHALQGFRLENGGTVTDIVEALRGGVGDDAAAAAAGHRTLLAKATLVGGAVGPQNGPIYVSIVLDPGTYYFLDLNDYFLEGLANPRVHELRAVGERGRIRLPAFDETISAVMMEHEGGHEGFGFAVPAELPRQGTYLMFNATDEIHDIAWRQARPGITDAYLDTFYDAVLNGTPRPASPWLEGNTHGLQGVSPARWAVVSIGLPAGNYATVCYVPSDETGIPHTYTGMHRMVQMV